MLENDKLRAEQNHQIELLNLKKELEFLKSSIDSKVQLVENQKQIDLNTKEQEYKDTIYKLELKYTTSLMEKDNEILDNYKLVGSIETKREEEIIIYAHEKSELIENIESLIKSDDFDLIGYKENRIYKLDIREV